MQFATFSEYLEKLENTPSRLAMTEQLAAVFKELKGDEIAEASYLFEGRLLPQYQSLEFQMSVKMVVRALARTEWPLPALGTETAPESLFGEIDWSEREEFVTAVYKRVGDIGATAQELAALYNHQQHKPDLSSSSNSSSEATVPKKVTVRSKDSRGPSISEVYTALLAIARDGGEGSQDRKVQLLVQLLNTLEPLSSKYVCRIIVGSMRLGFSTMTLLDALSWAMTGTKAESGLLENAYQKKADIGKLAQTYLSLQDEKERQQALENYSVEVGVPIVPQLCQVLASSEEVVNKMATVYSEAKYDGLRVQIHLSKKGLVSKIEDEKIYVKAFTRNLEDSTHMFPELQKLLKLVAAEEVILDGEAIGFDRATGKLLPFQETITRKRKHDIAATALTVPLKFFIFDVLAVDGRSLLKTELSERKKILKNILTETEEFVLTEYLETSDPKHLQRHHEEQLAAGLEGVVVKQVDSPYQSGRKGWHWVKMKQAAGTHAKLQDTIDCIVLGYYFGRGKRTAFGIGAFLVGILNAEQSVVTIAKIGTGISDEQLRDLKLRCEVLKTETKPNSYVVTKELTPDVWIKPELVTEIAADEVTRSPMHTAGVALRFPRLIRLRDDKNWQDATTVDELKKIAQI